jgi:hypothetical protein
LTPEDPVRSNISAVLFEAGSYDKAAMFAAGAHCRAGDSEADAAWKERMVSRIRKCLVLAQQEPEDWPQWEHGKTEVQDVVSDVRKSISSLYIQSKGTLQARKLLADNVAKYRPFM